MNEHNNQFEWGAERNAYGSALHDLNYVQAHRNPRERDHPFWRGVGKVAFWSLIILGAFATYPW